MRYSSFILTALAAGLVAAPALAQPAAPFTGVRVEGLLGYESDDFTGESTSGLLYGAGAGFDFQAGGTTLGIEAELSKGEADGCTANFRGTAGRLCANPGRDLYVGARAGAMVGPATLLYAKLGYTNARLNTRFSTGTPGAEVERRFTLKGFRVGAGTEFALGTNSFLKAEYRYSNYGEGDDFVGGNALAPVFLAGDSQVKHQLVGGFGFRF